MSVKKSSAAVITIGIVLLLSGLVPSGDEGVAFSQPVFAPPVNLGPPINSEWYESDPFWDGPRKRLYFVKAGPMTINGSEDLWYADWGDTGWSTPQAIGTQINSIQIEHSPSVSPDGRKLYFIRYPWDIFVSTWDSVQADWGPPLNLGCPVSTPAIEFSAKIGPDGQTLWYQSDDGTCDFDGEWGLYFSVWDSVAGWSTPQFLGYQVGVGYDPQYPSVTADHRWLYFDRLVSDGISIFVSEWAGTQWAPGTDLRPQIGERAVTPSVTPSGDSLFFSTPLLNSLGNRDIFLLPRTVLGDLNWDGLLTAADVVLEVNAVFLQEPFPAPAATADCNCSGQLSAADIVALIYAVFMETPFPCRI